MLQLKQEELARKAGISKGTLNNIERGVQTDPRLSTMRAIQTALQREGIEFTESENGMLGVQLKPSASNAPIPLLIIDDSPTDRRLYKAWLSAQHDRAYRLFEASNAKEGYDAFVAHAPACVILDFMMYGKDGFQLLVEMKRENLSMPPIIFVTAMHSDLVEKSAAELGVHRYLDKKKLTKEKLYAAIDSALV